jgi:MarR-like DNA-binding transcriptional regulator SgrR of sgrS sRNA
MVRLNLYHLAHGKELKDSGLILKKETKGIGNIFYNFGVSRMNNKVKIFIVLCASLLMIFSIKPYYGGEITIRLNEPSSYTFSPYDYSNLIFYSLLYENFFYLKTNGEIFSNIFSYYKYNRSDQTFICHLKNNISFSNGNPITIGNVKLSLKLFMGMKLESAIKLRRNIKTIRSEKNKLYIELLYDNPDITGLLTAPELVVLSGSNQVFSGMFYPSQWEKNRHIKLKANKYYPGGRTYLNSINVIFYDFYYPDIFLSTPGLTEKNFQELNAGIYQNVYLGFPDSRVSTNTRIALYTLLKNFLESIRMAPLSVLTSPEESPVTLSIKKMSNRRIISILRHSSIKLYILSSLKTEIEEKFNEYISRKRIRLEPIYLSDNELTNFLNNTSIKYLMMVKVFNKSLPIEEKIKKIIKEMSFSRYNAIYLKMLNELEEVKFLKNEELLLDQVSKLIEKIVNDGFLLPLAQKRFSLYVKDTVTGIELDHYGRPLFQKIKIKKDLVNKTKRLEK